MKTEEIKCMLGGTDVLERRRDDRTDRFREAAKNGMELAC